MQGETDEKIKLKRKIIWLRVLTAVMAAVFFLTICATAFAVYVSRRIDRTADVELYRAARAENVTRFYYVDSATGEATEIEGSAVYPAERHLFAPYETIPADLINAFVAIEDKRFFSHKGVDWYRTAGAALNYVFGFRGKFGASTITQQLVKNVTGDDEYRIDRKIREVFYALSLENQMEKSEILELYLNVINMSRGCRGVRSASLTYFSKELSELSLLECVCLAAITNSPTYYDPYLNPENNKHRRQLILGEMLEEGYIDESTYAANYDADVTLCMNEEYVGERVNSWYVETVIDDVCRDLSERYGYSESEALERIYGGGLQIYTLMDPDVQRVVESYYADDGNFPDSGSGIRAQTSMIIIDPYTGAVLGIAGARGEKSANRVQNYATDTCRPSGSVIKPLSVYAPALEKGLITYATVFDDVPVSYIDEANGSLTPWPNNAPTVYHGLVNVNYAVEVSLNTVPVRILDRIGREESFNFLKSTLGMESLIERQTLDSGETITDVDVASLALGQMNYGVTVREITAAYSIFPNGGSYCEARTYYLVTDAAGNVLLENGESETQAISRDNARIMNEMLMNVVDNGTAEGIELDKLTPVAGKTGTSEDYYDRWFIGYTPLYLGGVWYGYEYPKSLENGTKHICTEIWDEVMSEIYRVKGSDTAADFDAGENVITATYCRDSGKLMTEACRADPRGERSQTGYFIKGTEPSEACDRHVLVDYDFIFGGVADPSCPTYCVTKVGLLAVERHFPCKIYVSDAQYVYRSLPSHVLPGDSDSQPFFINTLQKGDWCGVSYSEKQYNRYCTEHFNYLAWILRRNLHN